jgi:hypothetical protein
MSYHYKMRSDDDNKTEKPFRPKSNAEKAAISLLVAGASVAAVVGGLALIRRGLHGDDVQKGVDLRKEWLDRADNLAGASGKVKYETMHQIYSESVLDRYTKKTDNFLDIQFLPEKIDYIVDEKIMHMTLGGLHEMAHANYSNKVPIPDWHPIVPAVVSTIASVATFAGLCQAETDTREAKYQGRVREIFQEKEKT